MTPSPALALVTGASSGIGEHLARQLAARGAPLVLVARSAERLQALAQELQARHGVPVHVLPADLAQPGAAQRLTDELHARGLYPEILVNNAGLGTFDEFLQQTPEAISGLIALNITALTELTRLLAPHMVAQGRGRILNVASTAAFQPGPLMAAYYASKAYVLSLSEALNEEFRAHGVSVTALCPGPVETGFQAASGLGRSQLLQGPVRLAMLSAEQVARAGIDAMLRGQAVVIPGRINQLQIAALRLLPRAVVPPMIRRLQAQRHA
ncbi:SDR family NAD(P)-dependent oxidoreductase [Deinococcus multiflagellatus]|uniref:SDR family NAD(P)-dependent oxidoreductase n=1 Tax=Deinococcus multiflagellatus TaxID=1656887 RepID=A0ABW1ZJL2_9DEIO|nr:SDR family oxidoreductase [Deinococcus multiflagellatus]MBZ9714367.1 SDR family oxidoreductase [Deinococcus multiflagellatus]